MPPTAPSAAPEPRAAAYASAARERQTAGAAFSAGLDAAVAPLRVENDAAGYRARTAALGDEHARALVRIDEELRAALGLCAAANDDAKPTMKAPRVRKPWAKAPPTTRQERFAKPERQLLRARV